MAIGLLRILTIIGVSVVLGTVHIEALRKLPWTPSAEQLQQEQEYREDLRDVIDQSAAILAEAGVDHARFVELVEAGAFVVDARPADQFADGHLDAAYVINLVPDETLERAYELEPLIQANVPIVIYCESETCEDSKIVYRRLRDQFGGLGALYVYPAGWKGIVAHNLPVVDGFAEDPLLLAEECMLNYLSATAADPAYFAESPDDQPTD